MSIYLFEKILQIGELGFTNKPSFEIITNSHLFNEISDNDNVNLETPDDNYDVSFETSDDIYHESFETSDDNYNEFFLEF
ncbi:MAG: hypothetical protein RBR89_06495 [Candidatus Bipolaricaulis sp.]|nr:hypothetical protein [Candidatus Bipolaricaulis sp.]